MFADLSNQHWFIIGLLPGIIVGAIMVYLIMRMRFRNKIAALLRSADDLLIGDMSDDALAIYYALSKVVSNRDLEMYGTVTNNEGLCYFNIARFDNTEDNLNRAIKAYKDALRARRSDRYPAKYAMTQCNLGNAYNALAEIKDRIRNLRLAIRAYQEALKVYEIGKYPIDYAATQNNLGTTYSALAEIMDREEYTKKAVAAYREALKIYTPGMYPSNHRAVMSNLKKTKYTDD